MNRTAVRALPVAMLYVFISASAEVALALEPANLRAGPVYFTPTLDLETFYTDNLWLTESNKKDTWASVITPRLQAWMQKGTNTYSLTYTLQDSRYASSSDDDFTDHQLNLDLHQEFNARNTLNLFGEYYDGHEQRGTGFIEGDLSFFTDKPVKYDSTTAGGEYTYGSKQSRGRVILAAKTIDYHYRNYREFTAYRDRRENTFASTFFWKIAARTDALLEVRAIGNDYDKKNPIDREGTATSDEMNYLTGVSWEATAKTSGHIKLGMYDRQYDSSSRSDDTGFTWEVGVTYSPRSYSVIDLQTRQYFQETTGVGDGINTRDYSVGWHHGWNQRSSTNLSLSYSTEDYQGVGRQDDNYAVEARYDYAFRRWVDLGMGYRWEDRDSDFNSLGYTANTYFLEAKLSL